MLLIQETAPHYVVVSFLVWMAILLAVSTGLLVSHTYQRMEIARLRRENRKILCEDHEGELHDSLRDQ